MSIYANLLELVNTYIYGGSVVPGSFEELVAITLATAGVIFVFALPFTVVLKLISMITGG